MFWDFKRKIEKGLERWSARSSFGRFVYRNYLDMKYPAYSKPSAFLKVYKKAFIYVAGTSLALMTLMPLLGDKMQKLFRSVAGDKGWTLNLDKANKPDSDKPKPPLFIGSQEAGRIINLQENLLTLGYPLDGCGANGQLSMHDLSAVNAFRQVVGTDTNSYVDVQTEQMIAYQAEHREKLNGMFSSEKDRAPDVHVFQESIFPPSASEKKAIRDIQIDLLQLGYFKSDCGLTGTMDNPTVNAVAAFKRAQKIYPSTGIVDPTTRSTIRMAARADAEKKGLQDIAERQGEDYISIVLYGQTVAQDDIEQMIEDYLSKKKVPEYIVKEILYASTTTGMDFTYMMDMASIESSYKPWVGAGTSTATGNFQFIESTWLATFKKHGTKYGPYADLIRDLDSKNATTRTTARGHILHMRTDPHVSALLAAEHALENLTILREKGITNIGKPELYIAHFLGADGAAKFIREYRKNPSHAAAPLFPEAARANAAVFKGKTLSQVYKSFANKMSGSVLRMTERKSAPASAALQDTPALFIPVARI